MSPELEKLNAEAMNSRLALGYIEKLDEPPRAEYVLARMEERRALARLKGKADDPEELGFVELGNAPVSNADERTSPVAASVLSRVLAQGSRSYLMPGATQLKQVHTNTTLGTLIIDVFENADTTLDLPNIFVNGEPATLIYIRHGGGKWATVIFSPSGRRLLRVEADRKLDGREREEFIRLVADLQLAAPRN